ncbi:twin-arginine translocation signal domain-containing protein [Pseudorhodoferax sp. LjRoot39]|uniref:twin-arginine translocation signal domain-containing protein n=1 Tax=Pseudorhodoferax sp. LjRoot39 TaxID=3342328 RepID=UPI003ED03911
MHVIPIAPSTHTHHSACEDERSGQVPKCDLPLARRDFLQGTGLLMGTLAAGSVLAALAPSPVWAAELKQLSTQEGQTLIAMGRVLYPHKKLPDAVYALLAKDLDAKAGTDAATATQLHEGLAALDQAVGGSFAKAPAGKRLAAVKAIEGTSFFNTVRGQCVTSLYDNDMAYAALGYPGSAWEKGGYITRGFQDLKWLPAPSKAASPPPFLG